MSSKEIEEWKARLGVCRQQLECNSLINTARRKEALREEIHSIETKLAQALGLEDDDQSDHESALGTNNGRGDDIGTPESTHLPPITSPGRTPSPLGLESPYKRPRIKDKERNEKTPPLWDSTFSTAEGSGSSVPKASNTEVESIRSALVDAGEEEMDIDALLKEQALMEQRLADLKRRRDEEDEAFARSLQDEQYNPWASYTSPPSTSAATSASSGEPSSSSSSKITAIQSKSDRARQERLDAEMAKLFAESDASSFDLAQSPKKKQNFGISHDNLPARPVFPIFEKRAHVSEAGSSTAPSVSGGSYLQPASSSTVPSQYSTLSGTMANMPPAARAATALQGHAAAILANASHQKVQRSDKAPAIDLTKPMIDLTKQVHDISSGDEDEDRHNHAAGGSYMANGAAWGLVSNFIENSLHGLWRGGYHNGGHYYDDLDDDDDDDEDDDISAYARHQWLLNQTRGYKAKATAAPYMQNRNLTQGETDKELRDLLANIQAAEEEISPEDRTGTPEGMAPHILLLEHQKIGLTWLQKMEDGTNRGGILADDMGLGKTIQTMALIVSRPSAIIEDTIMWDDHKTYYQPPPESELVKTKATLVVAPVALMYQWAEEIRSKTQANLLKVHIFHGAGKVADPEILRRYDVIITTPTTLANDAGVHDPLHPDKNREIGALFKVHFHRIVLDEAHLIKNKNTKSSKACSLLSATYRWCLTGTPIQNNIDELFSLIRFLHIKPYCEWEEFRLRISTPMKKQTQYGPAMQRVQALLKAVCLRRTKTCKVDGKPILNLPDRNVDKVFTPFTPDERAFYDALETRTRERFNAYVKAGTVMKNYSNILVLLLRLRQACCHPHLIKDFDKATDEEASTNEQSHVEQLLDNLSDDICRRLIEHGSEAAECPICMDVGEESVILSGCGHIYCRACIIAHIGRYEGEDRKCPECRRVTRLEDLLSVADFNARFKPTPVEPEVDPKGKGKAVVKDEDTLADASQKLLVEVPKELDQWISSSKIERMIEIVQGTIAKGEKIIVFSQFTSLLDLIEEPLRAQRIKYLKYNGKMSAEARNEAVHQMCNDPRIPLMLISLKCGSLGLNLTVANHVVIMDPWWNPALENQAIDRVHRIGQTRNVHVHRLCIPDTVEDRILALQQKKQALADGALGEGEVPRLAKLGLQELMYLFRGA